VFKPGHEAEFREVEHDTIIEFSWPAGAAVGDIVVVEW